MCHGMSIACIFHVRIIIIIYSTYIYRLHEQEKLGLDKCLTFVRVIIDLMDCSQIGINHILINYLVLVVQHPFWEVGINSIEELA